MSTQRDLGTRVRIGELSRRTGVSDHVLRAWERRYGLLEPVRSEGRFRLYSVEDERRVRTMVELLASGLAPAEAARVARASSLDANPSGELPSPGLTSADDDLVAQVAQALWAAVRRADDGAAHRVIDDVLSTLTVEAALRDVFLPFLRDLGDRWERGEATIAHEHFASQLLRGRIAALATGLGGGGGPKALLACPPGERHDLALLGFGLVLGRRGWAVTFLGADTPVESMEELLASGEYQAAVLSAVTSRRFGAVDVDLARLRRHAPLFLAGPGATSQVLAAIGAEALEDDPVSAAAHLTARLSEFEAPD